MKKPKLGEVTIVIKDKSNGNINVAVEFDPPITKDGSGTPAQIAAVAALEAIKGLCEELPS